MESNNNLSDVMNNDAVPLIKAALEVRQNAYAPYSRFLVGAALLTKSGRIFTGCNVENAAFTPSSCAERTALNAAVAAGEREFAAIAVVGGASGTTLEKIYPCGVCRQVLREFVPDDFPVIAAGSETDYEVHSFGELFPYSFGKNNLN